MTTVLVINCGSSSLKWSVIDTESGAALGSGTVQRVTDHGAADVGGRVRQPVRQQHERPPQPERDGLRDP